MRIAIIGTRGIPNNYGGFEQLAEFLSLGLREKNHEVWVYSSHRHPFREKTWKGINIIHCYDPEQQIGTIGQFVYDLNCILDSRKRKFDVILNLGYTSSSVWMRLFPRAAKLITNMDGLEWKRTKYSKTVQSFLKKAESWAVKRSSVLVADSMAIQDYLKEKYGRPSTFIAYGAELFDNPDDSVLKRYDLHSGKFSMLIARMEPENNIEMILDGVVASKVDEPFVVVGNTKNKFGTYLVAKYRSEKRIRFLGPIYDSVVINNFRFYCRLYFHGHSVGGTNPSLLEAMGCRSLIAAHGNEFNKSVLGADAFYFSGIADVSSILEKTDRDAPGPVRMVESNFEKIRVNYSWDKIVARYEKLMVTG
jgi:glycosyltransferase involved in cell wall biosynthesis